MSGDPPAVEGEGSLGALAASASLAGAQGEEEAVSAQTQTAERADAAVQAGPPPPPPEAQRRAALAEPHLAAFLAAALPRCEEALQQNELADALADELAALADEEACEADAAAAGSRGTGAGHAASSGSTAGVVEHHSFSDLVHSRGCALAAVALHPTRRGVAAVACAHSPDQPSAATAGAGGGATAQMQQQPPLGCVLVWSHTDAMHPEAVLQAPADVLALAFHPTQPHWLAAGLVTGQVALFNLQQVPAAAAPGQGRHAGPAGTGEGAARLRTDSFAAGHDAAAAADGDARVAALLPLFLSSPDASHQAPVTDLHWLPGAAVSRDGRLQAAEAGGGLAPLASPRADVAPSSASGVSVPAADGSCNLFATVAADGGLLVWDMRISSRHARKLAAGAKGKASTAVGASSMCWLLVVGCTEGGWQGGLEGPHGPCALTQRWSPTCPSLHLQTMSRWSGDPRWPWPPPAPSATRSLPPVSAWMSAVGRPPPLLPLLGAFWWARWRASWRPWMPPASARSARRATEGGALAVVGLQLMTLTKHGGTEHCVSTAPNLQLFPHPLPLACAGRRGVVAQQPAAGCGPHRARAWPGLQPPAARHPAGGGGLRLCDLALRGRCRHRQCSRGRRWRGRFRVHCGGGRQGGSAAARV